MANLKITFLLLFFSVIVYSQKQISKNDFTGIWKTDSTLINKQQTYNLKISLIDDNIEIEELSNLLSFSRIKFKENQIKAYTKEFKDDLIFELKGNSTILVSLENDEKLYSLFEINKIIYYNSNETNLNVNEFVKEFLICLINEDFERLKKSFPKPPFNVILKKKLVPITADAYNQYIKQFELSFKNLTEAFRSYQITLEKIETETDSTKEFTPVEIFITIMTNSNERYRIRLEDCIRYNGKFLPGQLKIRKI